MGGCRLWLVDFNPPAPCGAGPGRMPAGMRIPSDFNPPAPCGAGLRSLLHRYPAQHYFNPPAPCGAGPAGGNVFSPSTFISIHPPRAGRDRRRQSTFFSSLHFNPPAPCGAGPLRRSQWRLAEKFQSTRPVRGGTNKDRKKQIQQRFQSPRPVRGGTIIVR